MFGEINFYIAINIPWNQEIVYTFTFKDESNNETRKLCKHLLAKRKATMKQKMSYKKYFTAILSWSSVTRVLFLYTVTVAFNRGAYDCIFFLKIMQYFPNLVLTCSYVSNLTYELVSWISMSFTQVILLYSQTIDGIHTSDTVILTNYWWHSHKLYCYTHKLLMAWAEHCIVFHERWCTIIVS